MKLKMSFFDPTLLKKNLSRFSPAWVLLLISLLLAEPYTLLMKLQDYHPEFEFRQSYEWVKVLFREDFIAIRFFFAGFTAILFAGMLFQYLHKANSAYMIHAFPMTRNCLFFTNAISGLLFFLVPALISSLCQFAILGGYDDKIFQSYSSLVWTTLGKSCLIYLFFYGLAVFCVVLSGHGAISWLCYGALNIVFFLLPMMVLAVAQAYLPSLCFNISERLIYLFPAAAMVDRKFENLTMLAIYAGIGLLLLALAWFLYRRRHIERAGDPMAYGWARIAFRLVFTLSVALGMGLFLTELFDTGNSPFDFKLLFFVLMWCFIGWFGSSMIIERTIKVFRLKRIWIGFAAFAGVLTVSLLGIQHDVLGLQRKIPKAEAVESIEIWSSWSGLGESCPLVLTGAEDVELIRGIHQDAIDHDRREANVELDSDSLNWGEFCLCYRLKNGTTLRRRYDWSYLPPETQARLEQLCARTDLATDYYERLLPKQLTDAEIGYYRESYDETSYYCRNLSALRDALLADAAAGNLPIPSLIHPDSEDDNLFISLQIYGPQDTDSKYEFNSYVWVNVPLSAENTLALFLD